eukprot:Gb_14220 [translate_table: standard]
MSPYNATCARYGLRNAVGVFPPRLIYAANNRWHCAIGSMRPSKAQEPIAQCHCCKFSPAAGVRAEELFHAAVSGDEGKLRGLLGKNVRIKEQVTPRKNTALHLAAMKGHAEIVEMLLAHNSSAPTWVECVIEKCWPCTKWFGFERRISRAVNREGNTALHEAVVEALLDHDARSAWSLNNNHESAFFQACEKGHLHVVTYLLKVTNPWIIRWSTLGSSLTCLHGAVLGKNLEHMLHNSMTKDARKLEVVIDG